jgi:hypothetical protein
MARIRTIKPELPADLKLARVSRDARLTFVYLITQADDFGLVPGSPRQLLGLLFPHEDDVSPGDLSRWIAELSVAGFVRRRETKDGAPVLDLVNWQRHQRVDNRGRSVLADSLVPLAAADNVTEEDPAEVRGEPPRDAETRGGSPLGSGPWTLERDLGGGRGRAAADPPPDELSQNVTVREEPPSHPLLATLTPHGRRALAAIAKGHPRPDHLEAEVVAILDGMRPNVSTDPVIVSQALSDLCVNGGTVSAIGLRKFVQRAARDAVAPAAQGDDPDAVIARQLAKAEAEQAALDAAKGAA